MSMRETNDMRIAVLGGGSWGTTVAHLCAYNSPTVLYTRRIDVADAINERHENPHYLPNHTLNAALSASTDLAAVVRNCDVLVMGVPCVGFRPTLREVRTDLRAWVPVISLAKGLEPSSHKRMTQVIAEELPGHPVGVLTGPNLAKEILTGSAAAAVLAFTDPTIAERLRTVFGSQLFRVYTSDDVVGCELGGAFKNVIALAAGMADGLGTGDNTRAAIITRGLAEITRLGVAMGGKPATFAGLTGMGDLLATCMSAQSRNRHVGEQLGRGRLIGDIIAEMDQVAEGVRSAPVMVEIAKELGICAPIAEQVRACITDGRSAVDAYVGLVQRPAAREVDPA